MCIALLSDIHGNRHALEAVLADLQGRDIDRLVSLGDVAATGPEPAACVDTVASLAFSTVMGNADAGLLHPQPNNRDEETYRRYDEIDAWCAAQLSDAQRQTLASYAPTLDIPLSPEASLLAYHGSPRSYHDLIEATTPYSALEPWFADTSALVYAGGHTHQPFVRRYYDSFIINPGSVGLAYARDARSREPRNIAQAEYAIVDYNNGQVAIELRRVPYDGAAVVAAAIANGMPYAAWWGRDLLGAG